MENETKVHLWSQSLFEEYDKENLTSFNPNAGVTLRMANRQYDNIFNCLISGKTIRFANLDLSNKSLSQALTEAENLDSQYKRISFLSSEDYKSQNKKLDHFIKIKKEIYLTFGMLDYFEDSRMTIKSAPLVIMPIDIQYIKENDSYQLSNINHELYLNEPLINLLNSTYRIDISFSIDNDFSLIEYLTYAASKVRNNHFSVNNGCFIASFKLNEYFKYQDYNKHLEEICNLPLVKSISYLNAEFFNLNKSNSMRLDNNFLSMLNLDNEEYKIFKRLNLRENMVIRTNSFYNKKNLITNILYDFLLNSKNILITYENTKIRDEIVSIIKNSNLEAFAIDLNKNTLNKSKLLSRIKNSEKFEYDNKLLDSSIIDNTTDGYYLVKNNYKKIINALRKSNEPLKISINKAIYEYYGLSEYDLIQVKIPNIESLEETKINEYIQAIETFAKTCDNLKCNYKDHPFFGFSKLDLNQSDYLNLREKIISLSNEFNPSEKIFKELNEKYNLPLPNSLKEMKCILNILNIANEVLQIDNSWFEIENQQTIIDKMKYYNTQSDVLSSIRTKIISIYGDKVFLIDINKLKGDLSTKISKKTIKTYQDYFPEKAKIDETILSAIHTSLSEYYNLENELNAILNEYGAYKEYYHEGAFEHEKIDKKFKLINKLKSYCSYLNSQENNYSYKSFLAIKGSDLTSLNLLHKKCQIAFNHIFRLINDIQANFSPDLSDFTTMPLPLLKHRIELASKNFHIINDYLDFYLSWRKLNRIINNLGDELLKCPQSSNYIPMFFKRLYYDYAQSFINNNPLFKNYDQESFALNFKNYVDYNSARLDEIFAFIKNNLKIKLNSKSIVIRNIETPFINKYINSDLKSFPLSNLLNNLKNIIFTNFPIVLISFDQVSELLGNITQDFDLELSLPSYDTLAKDAVLSNYHCKQHIVFDDHYLSTQGENLLLNNENYLCSALESFSHVNYISNSYDIDILNGNKVDITLKKYIIRKLREHGFLVNQDINILNGTIDILVKVNHAHKSIAIIIDRLNYYSLESAIESTQRSNKILEEAGFVPYRIITSIFFMNEEQELNNLIDFIVKKSNSTATTKKVNRIRPLTEIIFEKYIDPQKVFISIKNKESRQKIDILKELLSKVSPIRKDDLISLLPQDYLPSLYDLQTQKVIRITNNFVFVENQEIVFKCVNKDENLTRDLSSVSNEEIASGIKKLINQRSFNIDYTIRLILTCLGLKKMNHNQYFRVENIIKDLVENKELILEESTLSINVAS